MSDVARTCRYSEDYLSLLVRKGRIPAIKFGRNWRISRDDLKRYEKEMLERRG